MTFYIGAWFVRLIVMIVYICIGLILGEIDVKKNEGGAVFFIMLWFAVLTYIIFWMP